MIVINNTCISPEVTQSYFVCDLQRCKGGCCREGGEAGAPLEASEAQLLAEQQEAITPFLSLRGRVELARQGPYISLEEQLYTPTINGRECIYAVYEPDGLLACGIEKAWKAGQLDFRKPISCHLYPIRIKKYDLFGQQYEGLYYHQQSLCNPACELGNTLQIPLHHFVKEALLRRYGQDWYNELLNEISLSGE